MSHLSTTLNFESQSPSCNQFLSALSGFVNVNYVDNSTVLLKDLTKHTMECWMDRRMMWKSTGWVIKTNLTNVMSCQHTASNCNMTCPMTHTCSMSTYLFLTTADCQIADGPRCLLLRLKLTLCSTQHSQRLNVRPHHHTSSMIHSLSTSPTLAVHFGSSHLYVQHNSLTYVTNSSQISWMKSKHFTGMSFDVSVSSACQKNIISPRHF